MDADLDTLCTAVYVTADDLLPPGCPNARRELVDAEVVTLAVAQVVMGIPSDRRFLAVAEYRLKHLFPVLPRQSGYHKRRIRLREAIDWLAGVFAAQSLGRQRVCGPPVRPTSRPAGRHRPAQPGTPRGPYPRRPARPHRRAPLGSRRLRIAQPPTRPTHPIARPIRGVSPWNQSSSPPGPRPARAPGRPRSRSPRRRSSPCRRCRRGTTARRR